MAITARGYYAWISGGSIGFLALLTLAITVEAFSSGVEKQLCRFFESKTLGVCNAFLHTKQAYQRETWHSKNAFSTPGLNTSNTIW